MKEETLLFLKKNPHYIGHFSSLKILKRSFEDRGVQPLDGQIASVELEDKLLLYTNNTWTSITTPEQPVLFKPQNNGISLYEINKTILENNPLPPYTEEEIVRTIKKINYWWRECKDKHLMLLFRDLNYYTIFELKDNKSHKDTSIGKDVIECILNIGEIFDIDIESEDGKLPIEIWVRNNQDDSLHVGYLFPYDAGVISIGG